MNLETCVEIGKECGLESVQECVTNVIIHSTLMFAYDKIDEEIKELYSDIKKRIENIEHERFMIAMKDRWSDSDSARDTILVKELVELKAVLGELKNG